MTDKPKMTAEEIIRMLEEGILEDGYSFEDVPAKPRTVRIETIIFPKNWVCVGVEFHKQKSETMALKDKPVSFIFKDDEAALNWLNNPKDHTFISRRLLFYSGREIKDYCSRKWFNDYHAEVLYNEIFRLVKASG